MTLEPGGCIDSRTKSVASDTKHGKDYCELGEFALSVAGDGSAIFGVELRYRPAFNIRKIHSGC